MHVSPILPSRKQHYTLLSPEQHKYCIKLRNNKLRNDQQCIYSDNILTIIIPKDPNA